MKKLVCMGECLIDFLPDDGVLSFTAKAGGAPANVCACAAGLGVPAYYMGKLSNDMFGRFLKRELLKYGVKLDFAAETDAHTALAFVSLNGDGDRDFSFYRQNTADLLFSPEEVADVFEEGDAFHFCSVSLVDSPIKRAHKKAIEFAKAHGAWVSFDVNLRLNLWESREKCKNAVLEFLPYSDVIKASDDEAYFLTGKKDEREAAEKLFALAPDAKLLFVTKGSNGAAAYDRRLNCVFKPAVKAKVADTTGAGDCFIGCVLYSMLSSEGELTLENAEAWLATALKGAAFAVSKKGAMEAMPSLADLNN